MLVNRKILLIHPIIRDQTQATPDLGLAFLAAALRNNGFDVQVLDCLRDHLTERDFADYVSRNAFGAVGIKLFSTDLDTTKRMVETVKRAHPETVVLLGGPHPSCSPDDILLEYHDADYAFQGEAENALPQFLNLLDQPGHDTARFADVRGLIYRDKGDIRVNPPEFIQDLDALGLPAWDLLDPRDYGKYENLWIFQKGKVIAPLHVVRGCPFDCTFCSGHTITGRKVRFRSLDIVMKEMRMLYDQYGVREFHIVDDFFTVRKSYVMDFCAAVRREKFDIAWCCPFGIRVDSLDAELLHTMEEAGCYGASVGIESGSQRVLDFVRKRLTPELVREKLDLIARETNWLVQGFFMIGVPTETREEIEATIDFACSLPLHLVAFTPYRISKGTELYDYLQDRGEIETVDWSAMNVNTIGYAPEGMTLEEVASLRRKAYVKFFLNPRRALTLLAQLHNRRQFKVLLQMVKRRLFG